MKRAKKINNLRTISDIIPTLRSERVFENLRHIGSSRTSDTEWSEDIGSSSASDTEWSEDIRSGGIEHFDSVYIERSRLVIERSRNAGLWWMLMLGLCMLWNMAWGQVEKKNEKRINLTIQSGNYFLIHDNYYSYELADITGKRISSKTKYKEQPFVSVGGQVWISKLIGFEIDAKFWSFNHYKTFESPLRYSDTGDILAFQIVNNRIDLEAGLNLRFINNELLTIGWFNGASMGLFSNYILKHYRNFVPPTGDVDFFWFVYNRKNYDREVFLHSKFYSLLNLKNGISIGPTIGILSMPFFKKYGTILLFSSGLQLNIKVL